MRVIHSPLHRLHEPPFEVFSGHPGPPWEVAARAEAIRAALAADPAFALELPAEHGLEPALAVHEPGLVRFLAEAWDAWRDGGGTGRRLHGRHLPAPGPAGGGRRGGGDGAARPAGAARAGRADRLLVLRHGDGRSRSAPGPRPARRWTWRCPRRTRSCAGEPVAYGLCRPPGHHAGRDLLRRLLLPQQRRDRRRAPGAGRGRPGRHPRRRLPPRQRHAADLLGARRTSPTPRCTAIPTGSTRTSRAAPTRRAAAPGRGATFNQPLPAGHRRRAPTWPRSTGPSTGSPGATTGSSSSAWGSTPTAWTRSGDFALTTPAYHEVGRRRGRPAGARLVVLQEGGYHLPDLGENVRQWLRGAAGPRRLGPCLARPRGLGSAG